MRPRRPSSASSASPCGTTPSRPASSSRWAPGGGSRVLRSLLCSWAAVPPQVRQSCTRGGSVPRPALTRSSLPARCAPRQLLGLPGAPGLCRGPPFCPHPPHGCHLRACAQVLVTQQHHLQCPQGLCCLCEYPTVWARGELREDLGVSTEDKVGGRSLAGGGEQIWKRWCQGGKWDLDPSCLRLRRKKQRPQEQSDLSVTDPTAALFPVLRSPAVHQGGRGRWAQGGSDWGDRGGACPRAGSSLILCSSQGFDEDLKQEGTLLGQFTYNQDGEPIQTFYFQVQDSVVPAEVAYSLPYPPPCARPQGSVRKPQRPPSRSPRHGTGQLSQ